MQGRAFHDPSGAAFQVHSSRQGWIAEGGLTNTFIQRGSEEPTINCGQPAEHEPKNKAPE